MPCLPASTKTALLARRSRLAASLELAHNTYNELLTESNESYRLDTAEGSQSAKKQKPENMLKNIRQIESMIASIDQRLRGSGISRLNLSRYSGGRG